MHIRFNRPLRGDYGRAKTGDVKMVAKAVGKSLVNRGLAEEVPAPKGESDVDPAVLEAAILDLTGKPAEEVEAAHSGPELHALVKYLGVAVPKNMGKPKLAAALVQAIAERPDVET